VDIDDAFKIPIFESEEKALKGQLDELEKKAREIKRKLQTNQESKDNAKKKKKAMDAREQIGEALAESEVKPTKEEFVAAVREFMEFYEIQESSTSTFKGLDPCVLAGIGKVADSLGSLGMKIILKFRLGLLYKSITTIIILIFGQKVMEHAKSHQILLRKKLFSQK